MGILVSAQKAQFFMGLLPWSKDYPARSWSLYVYLRGGARACISI